jgi:hypothetical protein
MTKQKEVFKTCIFNEAYKVSNYGRVLSGYKFGRELKHCDNGIGYLQVFLKDMNGKSKWYKIHRLVAMMFVNNPKPREYKEVNHIDNDKSNNYYLNLQWCSHSMNIQHAYDKGHRVSKKGIEHHNYGTKAKDSTKLLISISKIGVNHPKFKGYYCLGGVRYESAIIAGKQTNTPQKQVLRWASKNKNGWSFEPK